MVKAISSGSKDCGKHLVPGFRKLSLAGGKRGFSRSVLRRLPGGGDVQAEKVARSKYDPGDRKEQCESRGIADKRG